MLVVTCYSCAGKVVHTPKPDVSLDTKLVSSLAQQSGLDLTLPAGLIVTAHPSRWTRALAQPLLGLGMASIARPAWPVDLTLCGPFPSGHSASGSC